MSCQNALACAPQGPPLIGDSYQLPSEQLALNESHRAATMANPHSMAYDTQTALPHGQVWHPAIVGAAADSVALQLAKNLLN